MKILMQKFFEILPEKQDTAVALGFFDGVHAGHRSVISLAADKKKNGLVPVCFTFAQSPKSVLSNEPCLSIMTNEDKINTFEQIGIEHVFCADFKSLMNMSARDFVKDILADRLRAKALVCGFNYRFGKNGEGDVEILKSLGKEFGISVFVVPPTVKDGRVVSSTLIREMIKSGDVKGANSLLCGRFGFSADIEHGKRLGRQLGTPTINQPLRSELVVPRFGVYASSVTLENGEIYCGVTNIGVKPTVGNFAPLCETWMPEYSGSEIYGQKADVRLLEFIRPERKFADIEELKKTIIDNGKTAIKIFKLTY